MDSQDQTSYICRLDRTTRTVSLLKQLPSPVWYAKDLRDGWMLMATVVECGAAVSDRYARVLASCDGQDWHTVLVAEKDRWPMPLMKNGVVAFADGDQTSASFCVSAEGLAGMDGRGYLCSLRHDTPEPSVISGR